MDETRNTPPILPALEMGLFADAMPQIVWTTLPDGTTDYFNQRWYEYTGLTSEQSLDWGWTNALHPDDRQRSAARWTQAFSTGEAYEIEYRIRRADGVYGWHLGRGRPVRDAAGQVTRWVGTCTDIDDQKQATEVQNARAEREALLNRIGQEIRSTLDPDLIHTTIVSLLGEPLNADRCYFAFYDFGRDYIQVGLDWHRPGKPSVSGRYSASQFGSVIQDIFRGQTTARFNDAGDGTLSPESVTALLRFEQRAMLAVPLYEKGILVAALFVTANAPRIWTDVEASLVEAVAPMARAALELARVHARERRISDTLQGALQALPPSRLPGLELASHYQPAWDEASVGGDFSDVFMVEKGCYALVVGDLSGKGLAAASQVATVRNMLRYALYTDDRIAGAVTRLNDILISNNLLTGFATLVIVTFDLGMKTLTYVSCGQEPALLRRTADGVVQELPPTGPILGAAPNARYQEQVIPLAAGDAFALYTDGLTEAGPNRRNMLGVSGLAALLQAGDGSAEAIKDRMVQGTEAFSGGGFADDVCLLIGVVEPNGTDK